MKVHALNLGGWYDIFLGGTISNFVGMRESDPDQGLVIGPWTHGGRLGRA